MALLLTFRGKSCFWDSFDLWSPNYKEILLSEVTSFLNLILEMEGVGGSSQGETPYSSNFPQPPVGISSYLSTEFSDFLQASHRFLFLSHFLFISELSSLICSHRFNIIPTLVFWIFLFPLLTSLYLHITALRHVSLLYPLKFRKDKTKHLTLWKLLWYSLWPRAFCLAFLCLLILGNA